MPSVTRREILGVTAAGVSFTLAGCSSTGRTPTIEITSTSSTPVANGRASPAPSCRNGYSSLDPRWVVEGSGPLGGFDLTLESHAIAHGDTLTATLTNVTDEQQTTGNRKKYDIQYRAESGWHTIFGTEESAVWTDEGISHPPGDGFTWQLTVTQDGLTNAIDHAPTYYVCAPLTAGDYRFVYWGITSQKEIQSGYETEYAFGAPFTVSRD